MRRFILILLVATASLAAQAQVIKCTNPKTGAVTFSDAPCDSGQGGVVVQKRRSAGEIEADNQRAAEANERKYQQQAVEQDRQVRSPPQERPMQQQNQPDKSQSLACQRAQRDHEVISSSITGTEEHRRNRINASTVSVNAACGTRTEMIQPPTVLQRPIHNRVVVMSHCGSGFCQDGQGRVYHQNGPDHLTGPGGISCVRAGGSWACN